MAYFLDILKRLYHIINLIFKIIYRKKIDFMSKIEHFTTIEMKENNPYNIKRTWSKKNKIKIDYIHFYLFRFNCL